MFRHLPLLVDATTDNSNIQNTPLGEPFRVAISLRNPLQIPLRLNRVRLGYG